MDTKDYFPILLNFMEDNGLMVEFLRWVKVSVVKGDYLTTELHNLKFEKYIDSRFVLNMMLF
jgi:hypothetical protein